MNASAVKLKRVKRQGDDYRWDLVNEEGIRFGHLTRYGNRFRAEAYTYDPTVKRICGYEVADYSHKSNHFGGLVAGTAAVENHHSERPEDLHPWKGWKNGEERPLPTQLETVVVAGVLLVEAETPVGDVGYAASYEVTAEPIGYIHVDQTSDWPYSPEDNSGCCTSGHRTIEAAVKRLKAQHEGDDY